MATQLTIGDKNSGYYKNISREYYDSSSLLGGHKEWHEDTITNVYNLDILARKALQGGHAEAMAAMAKETDSTGKAMYAYLKMRQAEASKIGQVAQPSSVNPLMQSQVASTDTMKALDKAKALLNEIKSGKTLLG